MNPIEFCCPKGHKIKAKPELAGKLAKCPSCKSIMLVPEPIKMFSKQRESLTQSGVLRILGDAPQLPPLPEKSSSVKRSCPRCKKSVGPSLTICSNCQLYVGLNMVTKSRISDSEFDR